MESLPTVVGVAGCDEEPCPLPAWSGQRVQVWRPGERWPAWPRGCRPDSDATALARVELDDPGGGPEWLRATFTDVPAAPPQPDGCGGGIDLALESRRQGALRSAAWQEPTGRGRGRHRAPADDARPVEHLDGHAACLPLTRITRPPSPAPRLDQRPSRTAATGDGLPAIPRGNRRGRR